MISIQLLDELNNDLQSSIKRSIDLANSKIIELDRRLVIQSPSKFVKLQKDRLSWLLNRLIETSVKRLMEFRSAYDKAHGNILLLSPESTLLRGYSITSDILTGKIIRESNHVESGQKVVTRLKGGQIISVVESKSC